MNINPLSRKPLGIGLALLPMAAGALVLALDLIAPAETGAATAASSAYLPVIRDCASIAFDHIPAYGSAENLQGRVTCLDPAEYDDYAIAVYIFVGGWWTKPYFSSPLTAIGDDGRWVTDVTTGGNDAHATRFAAFLWPRAAGTPPSSAGAQALPAALFNYAYLIADRPPADRTIRFSDYTWDVKASDAPVGPGPNYFSDAAGDVWVDEAGRLHLMIRHRGNRWYSTEVNTQQPFGYGAYTFTLATPVDALDPNIVLGLFTWETAAPQYNYREIDIEFARWGVAARDDNAQYVVQPHTRPGNLQRFVMPSEAVSTHRFTWSPGAVHFASYRGRTTDEANLIYEWTYTGSDVPPAGNSQARLNLWLNDGAPPTDGEEVEIIIEAFEFSGQ